MLLARYRCVRRARRSRQLQHGYVLAFAQPGEHHDQLGDVCNAWDDFQETRDRDAVYGYLRAVLSIVKHYKGRHWTKKLMRRAYKFAGLRVDTSADPFAAVIRCTCDSKADNKTISKWSRALRYVARVKKPRHPLTTFMKNRGGINACAGLYAEQVRRSKR